MPRRSIVTRSREVPATSNLALGAAWHPFTGGQPILPYVQSQSLGPLRLGSPVGQLHKLTNCCTRTDQEVNKNWDENETEVGRV
jgi:hypothetical protein